tara:strand:- start:19 stop:243 length:225 start_codon:yes stop_codon:yes gene_type:complete
MAKSLVIFLFKEANLLPNAFYERIINAIGENDLKMLSDKQASNLTKKYEQLLKQKNGQLDEISYEDIIAVWNKL